MEPKLKRKRRKVREFRRRQHRNSRTHTAGKEDLWLISDLSLLNFFFNDWLVIWYRLMQ